MDTFDLRDAILSILTVSSISVFAPWCYAYMHGHVVMIRSIHMSIGMLSSVPFVTCYIIVWIAHPVLSSMSSIALMWFLLVYFSNWLSDNVLSRALQRQFMDDVPAVIYSIMGSTVYLVVSIGILLGSRQWLFTALLSPYFLWRVYVTIRVYNMFDGNCGLIHETHEYPMELRGVGAFHSPGETVPLRGMSPQELRGVGAFHSPGETVPLRGTPPQLNDNDNHES